MTVFFEVILPAFLIFALGFFVQKWKKMNIKSVSTVSVYILSPILVLRTFYSVELNQQYLYMTIFAFLLFAILIIVNKVYVKIRKFPRNVESALILSTVFMNAGNYGAPIILFAFGETGFAYAISFLVLQSIIMNFFGIYYAARGEQGIRMAIASVFKMPLTYALFLGVLLNIFKIPMPSSIFSVVNLVADAAIPMAMIILGMQLSQLDFDRLFFKEKVLYSISVRMVLSPLIAAAIMMFIPFDPLLKKVLILISAMPTAATITMYAIQFDAMPKLVSSVTFATTILSIVTISVMLVILG